MEIYPLRNSRDIMVASEVSGISPAEIEKKKQEALYNTKRESEIQWAIDHFNKDREWFDKTMQKINDLKESVSKELSFREQTIEVYGWIANELDKNIVSSFSIPLEKNRQYTIAHSIELILTEPSLYNKIINWD